MDEDLERNEDKNTNDLKDGSEKDVIREKLAAKFMENKVEPQIEIEMVGNDQQKTKEDLANRVKERVEDEDVFEAVSPAKDKSYLWTIVLVLLLLITMGSIVYLAIRTGGGTSSIDVQKKMVQFNEIKIKFDQSMINSTNKLIEAENNFNTGKYAEANELAKEAEDGYSESMDYLYDVTLVDLGEDKSYMSEYYQDLEEALSLGESMSNTLAYAARSADRGEENEVNSALLKYKGYGEDFGLLSKKVAQFKTKHQEFFAMSE